MSDLPFTSRETKLETMKKINLEESIRNTFILIKQGVNPLFIKLALKTDGVSSSQANTIIRWAQMNRQSIKIENIIDVEATEM